MPSRDCASTAKDGSGTCIRMGTSVRLQFFARSITSLPISQWQSQRRCQRHRPCQPGSPRSSVPSRTPSRCTAAPVLHGSLLLKHGQVLPVDVLSMQVVEPVCGDQVRVFPAKTWRGLPEFLSVLNPLPALDLSLCVLTRVDCGSRIHCGWPEFTQNNKMK